MTVFSRTRRLVSAAAWNIWFWAWPVLSFAQSDGYDYGEEVPERNFIFALITGGFGGFVIVFMGFGGVATIMMTRQGNSSNKVPVLGVIMVIIAVVVFAYRVMINAGIMGHEHMRW